MPKAEDILGFSFSPNRFQEAGKKVITPDLDRLLTLRVEKLNAITERLGAATFHFDGEALIPQVFRKFKKQVATGHLMVQNYTAKEIRALTFALSFSELDQSPIISNQQELDFLFRIMDVRWRDGYMVGLMEGYLKNWEHRYRKPLQALGVYIYRRLQAYEGNRLILLTFQKNIKYFKADGDELAGRELVAGHRKISEVTTFLSLSPNWFTYPYFSRVIVEYYKTQKNNLPGILDELDEALHIHNYSPTQKRLISQLIIQADRRDFAHLQDKVKSMAEKLIGDPGKETNWAPFDTATDREKDDLSKAKTILNEWITREFINVFFEKCFNDPRRRRFWLKYSSRISRFRVVGSAQVKRMLLNDKRISEYVVPRFSSTNSARDSNAALMFIMKDHLFIEFSDEGAFYVYLLANKQAPSIDRLYFESTSDLKDTSLDWLAYRTGRSIYRMSHQGRLGHGDGELLWEEVAAYWLKHKGGIHV